MLVRHTAKAPKQSVAWNTTSHIIALDLRGLPEERPGGNWELHEETYPLGRYDQAPECTLFLQRGRGSTFRTVWDPYPDSHASSEKPCIVWEAMERKEALGWLFCFASLAKYSAERAVHLSKSTKLRKPYAHQCQYLSVYSPTARYAGKAAAQGQAR